MYKKRLKYRKITALLLSLILMLCSVPISAQAVSSTSEATDEINENELFLEDEQEFFEDEVIGAVVEVEELREENVKHFRLDNGTYEVVVYDDPVHRLDADGKWQDIDNNLALQNIKGVQLYSTSDARVHFAKGFAPNSQILSLNEEGYSLSMSFISNLMASEELSAMGTVAEPLVTNAPTRSEAKAWDTLAEAIEVNNSASIVYPNVRANTDLEYILQGNNIKENIIVKAPSASYVYRFRIQAEGLVAELDDTGNVRLFDADTGEQKYIIPAPYMYDANGEVSHEVVYGLTSNGVGDYNLSVVADSTWINSSEREFPVTIDPTIVADSLVYDTYISSILADTNYGSSTRMSVSTRNISFIRVELPDLPDDATISKALLTVPQENLLLEANVIGAYQVLNSWDAWTLTWNIAAANENMGLATTALDTITTELYDEDTNSADIIEAEWDITAAAQQWLTSYNNYGVALKFESGSSSPTYFKTVESDVGSHAYLRITYSYVIPDGVYMFKNYYQSNRWITIENDYPWENYHMQHQTGSTLPTDSFDRSCLFKISRTAAGSYIIRSMLNNNLTFGISGTEVITKYIPGNDAEVSRGDTFVFEWNASAGGYIFYPYGSSKAVTISTTLATNLTTCAKTSTTPFAVWNLVQYTGTHRYGHAMYFSGSNVAGKTRNDIPVVWSTVIGANQPYMYIHTNSSAIATGVWNNSTRKLLITIHDEGQVQRVIQIRKASTTVHSMSRTFTATLPYEEGTYFIQNKAYETYLQIDNDQAPNYSASGAGMEAWEFDGGTQQKWNLIHVIDGYYKIISEQSNLALTVQADYLNSNAQSLVQQAYSGLASQKWKISETSRGNYVFRPQSAEAYEDDWCMCISDASNVPNGRPVEQKYCSDDDNLEDEWILSLIKYSFTVNHYVDDGYQIRFSSTGEDVAEYQDICSEILFEVFGIESTYTISTYCSCADTCTGTPTTLLDTTTACTHSNINHKTRLNIRDDVVSQFDAGDATTAKIAWTGHVLESRSSSSSSTQHVIVMTIGMVTDENNNNLPTDTIRDQRIYTLLHEISHQLGAPDHYCYDEKSSNCNNPTNDCWRCDNGLSSPPVCIMTSRTYDIEDRLLAGNADTLYCSQCKSFTHSKGIPTHLEDHHK